MNKLFLKIGAIMLGAGLVVGSGVAIAAHKENFKAASADLSDQYEEVTLSDGVDVLIVGNNGSYYAMGSAGGTSNPPEAISCSVSDGFLTSTTDLASHVWHVTGSAEGWTFTKTGGTDWLYCTNTNNGVRVGSNANKTFTISSEGYLLHSGTSRYVGVYNSADWRCYTTINNNIKDQTFSFWSLHEDTSLKSIKLQNTSHAEGPYTMKLGSSDELCLLGWDVDADTPIKSGLSWTFSNNDVVNHSEDSFTWTTITPKAAGSVTVSVTAEGYKTASTTISVSDIKTVEEVYSLSKGTLVEVYGYFAGNKDGNNILLMDGDFGIDVYKNGCGTNSYVEDETIIHVAGKIDIYNGLYEIADVTTLETVETYAGLSKPVTYACQGGETAEYASRRTTVSGVPSMVSGTFPETAGSSDISLNFDLGGSKTVKVFYKKAVQTADADAFAAIKAAVTNSTNITVKGCTAWYNGFQVQMSGLIPASTTYTAALFAQELLDLTDAVCSGYDGVANNHDALVSVWNTLSAEGKYPSLPAADKTTLGNANADEESTDVIEKAMARYDYLTAKYHLANFINGRTPSSGTNMLNPIANNSVTLIVVIASGIALISLVGTFFIIRKRKTQR